MLAMMETINNDFGVWKKVFELVVYNRDKLQMSILLVLSMDTSKVVSNSGLTRIIKGMVMSLLVS